MMKSSIPSTIDHAFLPRRKSVFYLPKIGKSHRILSLEEIKKGIESTQDLEEIQWLFSEFIHHFTVYDELLSEIKNEYSKVLKGLLNIQKEKEFLKFKIQNLTAQNGHEGMLSSQSKQAQELKRLRDNMTRDIAECRSSVMYLENELVRFVANLYKKTLNELTDERQRMLLSFKGRIGFIKDWLLENGSNWPEFLELYREIETNPEKFKDLLSSDEDYVIEKYDSQEVKKTKTDIVEQNRKSESTRREIERLKENIARFQSLIAIQDSKMEELKLLFKKRKAE